MEYIKDLRLMGRENRPWPRGLRALTLEFSKDEHIKAAKFRVFKDEDIKNVNLREAAKK